MARLIRICWQLIFVVANVDDTRAGPRSWRRAGRFYGRGAAPALHDPVARHAWTETGRTASRPQIDRPRRRFLDQAGVHDRRGTRIEKCTEPHLIF